MEFTYLGHKFTPVRKLTKAEQKKGIMLPLTGIGFSNYKDNPYQSVRTSEYSWTGFYEAAKAAGCYEYEVFLMDGLAEVIPGSNELFARNKEQALKLAPIQPPTRKFILGFNSPEDDFLTEYPDKKRASYESEEWCEVEAVTLDEAKAKYEKTFATWQSGQVRPVKKNQKEVFNLQDVRTAMQHAIDHCEDINDIDAYLKGLEVSA